MVEEQVDVEVLAADGERILAAQQGEAGAHLQQQIAHMGEQAALQVPLVRFVSESQEVEIVRIFEQLLGEVRLRRGQRLGK